MVWIEIEKIIGLGAYEIVRGARSTARYANRLRELVEFLQMNG